MAHIQYFATDPHGDRVAVNLVHQEGETAIVQIVHGSAWACPASDVTIHADIDEEQVDSVDDIQNDGCDMCDGECGDTCRYEDANAKFMAHTKKELVAIADDLGLDTDRLNKKAIVDLIVNEG